MRSSTVGGAEYSVVLDRNTSILSRPVNTEANVEEI